MNRTLAVLPVDPTFEYIVDQMGQLRSDRGPEIPVRNSRELKIVKQAKKYIIFCFVGM
jgi:hypothetical protein